MVWTVSQCGKLRVSQVKVGEECYPNINGLGSIIAQAEGSKECWTILRCEIGPFGGQCALAIFKLNIGKGLGEALSIN